MRKHLKSLLGMLLCIGLLNAALFAAAESEDSEESLRWLLSRQTGQEEFTHFYYGDYDGDGIHEAFALVGPKSGAKEMFSGTLWFISPRFVNQIDDERGYLQLEMCGVDAPILFSAEEWYGGSGSTTRLWTVVDSAPVQVEDGLYGDMTYAGGNEFHAYLSAYDGWSDGTGHTWKCYYYFLDGVEMREYGGINISKNQLLTFEGAEEILLGVMEEGYEIDDIIYRANGIINVNIFKWDGFAYLLDNLTLRYDDARVVDTGERYGGKYDLAGSPAIAVYPERFVQPTGGTSSGSEDERVQTGEGETSSVLNELGVYCFDDLKKVFVSDVEACDKEGLLEVQIHLQNGVNWGGTSGYQEHWTTESGILADKMIDLDGDGQEEWVVLYSRYQTRSDDDDSFEDSLEYVAVYESTADGYAKAAEFGIDRSLFPLNGEDSVRFIQTQEGVLMVHAWHYFGDGGSFSTTIRLYQYDGSDLSLTALAHMTNSGDSYFARGRLPVNIVDELYAAYLYSGAEIADYLQAQYGLQQGSDIILYESSSDDGAMHRDYAGMDGVIALLRAYGLEAAYTATDEEDSGAYMDGYALAGGDLFYSAKDDWQNGSSVIRLMLDTRLDHFADKEHSAEPQPAVDPTHSPEPEAEINAPQESTGYTTGNVNIRTGPGLGYDIITSIPSGSDVAYLGDSQTDERGVAWYKIRWNGHEGWGSSKYVCCEDS